MNGGPSQVGAFDPQREMDRWPGKLLPTGGTTQTERVTGEALRSPFKFFNRGKCGIPISELANRRPSNPTGASQHDAEEASERSSTHAF